MSEVLFRAGQQVVCVDDADTNYINYQEVTEGQVYTVYKSVPGFVWLLGFNRLGTPLMATRFRPVVSRPTDISFAHDLLRKASRELANV